MPFFPYQLHTSRLKCLKTWHEYTVRKTIQEERKLMADEHRRLTRLKGSFQNWSKQVRVCCAMLLQLFGKSKPLFTVVYLFLVLC